jgi:hypothetical protein
VLGDYAAALAATANAGNPAAVSEDFLDGESLAGLGPRRGGGVDEQLVEDGPARGIGDRGVGSAGRARDGERAKVERIGVDRRAPRRQELVEESPSVQRSDPGWLDDMGRNRVAGEGGPIDEENSVSLAS